jgi:crotonobetainyl-CoA:carnitine CoA-transferase CaiB-like acyl-CoA transferase
MRATVGSGEAPVSGTASADYALERFPAPRERTWRCFGTFLVDLLAAVNTRLTLVIRSLMMVTRSARTQVECIEQLIKAEVAVAPITDFKNLADDPHLNARQALADIDDPELGTLRMLGVQPRLSDTPGRMRHAGLPMGLHNEAIYGELLGLTEGELKVLKADGVI